MIERKKKAAKASFAAAGSLKELKEALQPLVRC